MSSVDVEQLQIVTVQQVPTVGQVVDAVLPPAQVVEVSGVGLQGPPGQSGPLPIFSSQGDLAVKVGTSRLYFDAAQTIASIRASVGTSPVGASIIVDARKNGTTLFPTNPGNRPTIAPGSFTVTAVPDVVAFSAGDYLTVDIVQVGTASPGANLTVQIRVK
jgi:hypothetical protein